MIFDAISLRDAANTVIAEWTAIQAGSSKPLCGSYDDPVKVLSFEKQNSTHAANTQS
jgi:hypothetical protein